MDGQIAHYYHTYQTRLFLHKKHLYHILDIYSAVLNMPD